jgi:hypothetical protein
MINMKCENCKLDLSSDNRFIKGIGKEEGSGDLVGWLVSIECPHCRLYQLIPIADYGNFCAERLELLSKK